MLYSFLHKYKNISLQAKLAFWLMISGIIIKGISLITVPIFSRILSTDEYGMVSTYLSWRAVFLIVTSFNLTAGVYNKGLSKYKDNRQGYCLTMQLTTSVLTLVFLCIYLFSSRYINKLTDMSTAVTLLLFVDLFFSTSQSFWAVNQQYSYEYKKVVAATLTYAFLDPIISLIIIGISPVDKAYSRIIGILIARVAVGGFFYILNLIKGYKKIRIEYVSFALIFNLPLIPHYFSEYILNQSDRIMIQKLTNYTNVALYSVAYSAGMVLMFVSSSLNQALTPWLYQSLDSKSFEEIRKKLLPTGFLLFLPVGIFIALAPEMIYLLAGAQYAEARYVVPPVTGSIIFLFFYTNFANIEFYYDYNKFTMYISLIGAVINIVTNYIFIRLFGYLAAGYTTFFSYFVYFIGHFVFMSHIVEKKEGTRIFELKEMLLLSLSLLVFMIVIALTYDFIVLRMLLVLVFGIIIWIKRELFLSVLKK